VCKRGAHPLATNTRPSRELLSGHPSSALLWIAPAMNESAAKAINRRPIATRNRKWHSPRRRGWLHESRRMQFRLPDLCACIAAALALGLTSVEYNRLFWLFAALGAQLRLRANMLDGMVALVSARASKVGELYNEVPDRVWDAAVFIGQVTPVAEHCAWLHRNDSGVLHCLRSRRGKNRRLA